MKALFRKEVTFEINYKLIQILPGRVEQKGAYHGTHVNPDLQINEELLSM